MQVLVTLHSSTVQVDEFVFLLVCKCPPELTDTLVRTLNRHVSSKPVQRNPAYRSLAKMPEMLLREAGAVDVHSVWLAARRFVRAVSRIYLALKLEATNGENLKKKRIGYSSANPLTVCRHIFLSLPLISLAELPRLAKDILGPVRFGLSSSGTSWSALEPRLAVNPATATQSSSNPQDPVQALDQVFQAERTVSRQTTGLSLLSRMHSSRPLVRRSVTSPQNRTRAAASSSESAGHNQSSPRRRTIGQFT
ncbi:E3 ubiquitin-protein ligase ubr5 [Cichlidogyrus casuarinus]|uniref:E3 ubiquitin-protein ligase ubr5 n=1 Tax=Cichlidogyrus casuarinus TaxID=1844966 RepID=A0ABD2QGB7_9PLAT